MRIYDHRKWIKPNTTVDQLSKAMESFWKSPKRTRITNGSMIPTVDDLVSYQTVPEGCVKLMSRTNYTAQHILRKASDLQMSSF
jgi:hypothetical protein